MTDPLLFTADEVLTGALESMYSSRPNSFRHLNFRTGVYWHPFLGFRGQTALAIERVAAMVSACSLRAEGQDLLEYVSSEFDTVPDLSETTAVGSCVLTRTEADLVGDIPAGSVIERVANLTTQVPQLAASYVTLVPVHFAEGDLVSEPVPIAAKAPGPNSNHALRTDAEEGVFNITSQLFDNFTVSIFTCAGGGARPDDEFIRRYARAFSLGQYGPVEAAGRYAVMRATGVRNILPYDDTSTGTQIILVADSMWGSSQRWADSVTQAVYDANLVGFGCKLRAEPVRNKVVSCTATVAVRDSNSLRDTTALKLAVRKATRAYFDDRLDWNVWKTRGLKAAITGSDPKILRCTSVTLKDLAGNTLSEIASPDYSTEQFHYLLGNDAMNITFTGPT